MKWGWIFAFVILVFLPVIGSPAPEPYVCVGKYKDGSKPDQDALKIMLSDHIAWFDSGSNENDTRRANLCNANLSDANLSGTALFLTNLSRADLSGADLSRASLIEANLITANLSAANLSGASLYWAKLSGAKLILADLSRTDLSRADLSGADLENANLINTRLININLSNAKFTNVNLERAIYEPSSTPNKAFLGGIQNIDTVRFGKEKQSGLVLLRRDLKEVGLRELERQATYAIEKGKTDHTTSVEGGIIDHVSSWLEQFARRLFFEYTAGYGLYPGQSLIILLSLIPVFAFIYFFSVYKKQKLSGQHRGGIYRIWLEERIRKDLGSAEPELITSGFIKSIGYALYFSLLSAFDMGWRDINVGNWIARIQPREYTLRATGWVRTVSGIQSLISIYLLVFWVLTQFGRPFN